MHNKDKDYLRNEIDGLINDGDPTEGFPDLMVDAIEPLNLPELNNQTKAKAQKIVISCMKLYFDSKIITKNEFMQAKAAVTTGNIKTLFRQIKIAEHMVDKIVNGIDGGDMNPRLFEVAGQLQSNIIDMLKNVQLHVISMQEEFRRMQGELPADQVVNNHIDVSSSGDTKVYTNSKALLNDLDNEETEVVE
tara:strand:+ start:2710 stop:3282 length:573 start_codon:yes stop_codon:yes gene_type:complete